MGVPSGLAPMLTRRFCTPSNMDARTFALSAGLHTQEVGRMYVYPNTAVYMCMRVRPGCDICMRMCMPMRMQLYFYVYLSMAKYMYMCKNVNICNKSI